MTATDETTAPEAETLFDEIVGLPADPDRRWAAGDLFSLDLLKRNDGDDDEPTISVSDDFSYFPAGKVAIALRRVADMLERQVKAHREIRAETGLAQEEYLRLRAEGMDKEAAKRLALLKLLASAKDYAAGEIAELIKDAENKGDTDGEAPPTP